jgi:hypothetical protein
MALPVHSVTFSYADIIAAPGLNGKHAVLGLLKDAGAPIDGEVFLWPSSGYVWTWTDSRATMSITYYWERA